MIGAPSSVETVERALIPSADNACVALYIASQESVRVVMLPPQGSVTVGRSCAADIRINDPAISRTHMRIHLEPPVRIQDLSSSNGTTVRGQPLLPHQPEEIALGDAIEIGSTLIIVQRRPSSLIEGAHLCGQQPELGDAMQAVLRRADRAAQSDAPVLLLGETGVGKDVLAERIHRASPRRSGPFLRVNCASISHALLESELFGHQKGAFTGASGARPGLLQSAQGGTVLLDEVAELPLELQAKLLLVVERREATPVGADKPRRIDVRFISATCRDLQTQVQRGLFREDLYYRLHGIPITIPPLRERRSELPGLLSLFAAQSAAAIGRSVPRFEPAVLELFHAHRWPGNIRELRATVERLILLSDDGTIGLEDVPELFAMSHRENTDDDRPTLPPNERERIVQALASCAGNQSRAAKVLGMSRNTLLARLAKYELARPMGPR